MILEQMRFNAGASSMSLASMAWRCSSRITANSSSRVPSPFHWSAARLISSSSSTALTDQSESKRSTASGTASTRISPQERHAAGAALLTFLRDEKGFGPSDASSIRRGSPMFAAKLILLARDQPAASILRERKLNISEAVLESLGASSEWAEAAAARRIQGDEHLRDVLRIVQALEKVGLARKKMWALFDSNTRLWISTPTEVESSVRRLLDLGCKEVVRMIECCALLLGRDSEQLLQGLIRVVKEQLELDPKEVCNMLSLFQSRDVLRPVTEILQEVGEVDLREEGNVRHLLETDPLGLVEKVNISVSSTKRWFTENGIEERVFWRLAVHNPATGCRSTDALEAQKELLMRFGLMQSEAMQMLIRHSSVVPWSSGIVEPKLRYLFEVMEYPVQVLIACPKYLRCSLEGNIKPRHQLVDWLVKEGKMDKPAAPTYLFTTEAAFLLAHGELHKDALQVYKSRNSELSTSEEKCFVEEGEQSQTELILESGEVERLANTELDFRDGFQSSPDLLADAETAGLDSSLTNGASAGSDASLISSVEDDTMSIGSLTNGASAGSDASLISSVETVVLETTTTLDDATGKPQARVDILAESSSSTSIHVFLSTREENPVVLSEQVKDVTYKSDDGSSEILTRGEIEPSQTEETASESSSSSQAGSVVLDVPDKLLQEVRSIESSSTVGSGNLLQETRELDTSAALHCVDYLLEENRSTRNPVSCTADNSILDYPPPGNDAMSEQLVSHDTETESTSGHSRIGIDNESVKESVTGPDSENSQDILDQPAPLTSLVGEFETRSLNVLSTSGHSENAVVLEDSECAEPVRDESEAPPQSDNQVVLDSISEFPQQPALDTIHSTGEEFEAIRETETASVTAVRADLDEELSQASGAVLSYQPVGEADEFKADKLGSSNECPAKASSASEQTQTLHETRMELTSERPSEKPNKSSSLLEASELDSSNELPPSTPEQEFETQSSLHKTATSRRDNSSQEAGRTEKESGTSERSPQPGRKEFEAGTTSEEVSSSTSSSGASNTSSSERTEAPKIDEQKAATSEQQDQPKDARKTGVLGFFRNIFRGF